MNCVWFGGDNAFPSNSATNYNFLVPCFTSSWIATETSRQNVISEDITVTKFTVYLDAAPGAGTYTFTIRDDAAPTAASVAITGASTTGTWTGSASIAALSLVGVESVPTTTPTTGTVNSWIVEYSTGGQYFLMMGGSSFTAATGATNYNPPCGSDGTALSATVTDYEIVIPSSGTLTKLTAALDINAGAGTSYSISARTNNTTDNLTTTITGASQTVNSTTGSVALSAGDTLVTKVVPTTTPAARRVMTCMTIAPTTNGEIFYGVGSPAAPSTTTTTFGQMLGNGNNAWNTTESTQKNQPPAVTFKKLYVKLTTDPNPGSRTFALMDTGAATALTCTVNSGSTTANDTTHTVNFSGGGNTGTFRSTVTGSPAATNGVHIGYVMAITQPTFSAASGGRMMMGMGM